MKSAAKKKAPAPVLFVTGLEPEERERVERFAEALGRPVSWVARDALRCYLDVLEGHVDALREKLENPGFTIMDAGETPLSPRGRPPLPKSDK